MTQKPSLVIQKPLKTKNINLFNFFMQRSRFNASKVLCRCFSQELTFNELRTKSEQYAKALCGVGVKEGDIVPICSEPSIEAIIAFFALNRLGAVSTFLNSTASIEEIEAYAKLYSSKIILLSNHCMQRLSSDGLFSDHCFDKIIVLSDNIAVSGDYFNIESLANEYATLNPSLDFSDKNAPAHISYTSGTTGLPKAIVLSNENIMAAILAMRKATFLQFAPKRNALQVVPFNYPYGFITTVLLYMYGGKTVALAPSLTLENISDYLEKYRPYYINGIPSFFKSFINNPVIQKMDLSFLKYPITGGDTLDTKAEKEINDFLKSHKSRGKISNGYGNGEGCGALLNPASLWRKFCEGSCGRTIPGLSVKLVDDTTDKPVPIGKSGRFCFSGTNVMKEYFTENTDLKNAFKTDADGRRWFYTDTFMTMNKSGWMLIDGRDRRFFITYDESGSPYKVYCDYTQKVISSLCESIKDCAVVQRPDKTRSYVPVAFICMNKADFNDDFILDLKKKCSKKLQSCAIPVEFFLIDELPLTIAGKVDYRALEDRFEQ